MAGFRCSCEVLVIGAMAGVLFEVYSEQNLYGIVRVECGMSF